MSIKSPIIILKSSWFNMNNKKAFSIIELLVALIIIAIISVNAMVIYKEFFHIQQKEYEVEVEKIELLNTKYFLQKNIKTLLNESSLNYYDNNLFYKEHLLLKHVTKFDQTIKNNRLYITLCVNNRVCKEWIILP